MAHGHQGGPPSAAPPAAPTSTTLPCVDRECESVVAVCPRTLREYLRGPTWMPSERAIEELDGARTALDALSASLARECEWSIDWHAALPDLASMRSIASILDADSRRLERFSRRDEAAARIVAMFDLARALARIPRLDAQREAARLALQACARAEQFFVAPPGSAPSGAVRAAIDAFMLVQNESLARCVAAERIRWVSRPVERIRLGQDGAALYRAATLESAADISKSNEYPLSRLAGELLLAEMRLAEAYFEAAQAAWLAPDATAQLAALAARAERGELGAWIAAARPSFVRVRGEIDRARATLKVLRHLASERESAAPKQLPAK